LDPQDRPVRPIPNRNRSSRSPNDPPPPGAEQYQNAGPKRKVTGANDVPVANRRVYGRPLDTPPIVSVTSVGFSRHFTPCCLILNAATVVRTDRGLV
jgi:hypothetical protein